MIRLGPGFLLRGYTSSVYRFCEVIQVRTCIVHVAIILCSGTVHVAILTAFT